ncbi:glycoside hydrolase family 3 C-terminal domain-containing protein [Martelella sp. HB161492]|uniref:beta-glucosidase n=1 Tax=Martelella sp. HB161492 TaxID=2720726 RepID=UPI0015906309|nr:glycoside hydrolase family 3 C-terminal domain-containing protein [Martelella sp. HB161492]
MDKAVAAGRDIEALVRDMTLEEQVSLLSGADSWTTNAVPRLGIPKIKVSDGPNGARGGGSLVGGVKASCFPCAISLGASWSADAAYAMGAALAKEARSKGAAVLLAPTVNIHRSGLNGRNFECYSEDPALTAGLAVGYITGLQDNGVAATIKHFVGNDSEYQRQTISSDIDERTLREIYLPPFEAAVKKAGVWAVMSSYNRLNGTYTSENGWLLTTVLRAEWGYDGIVMSDWFGSHSTIGTVKAGLDLEMPGPTRDRGEKLVDAVRSGALSADFVETSAARMLTLIERVGAFDDPEIPAETSLDTQEIRALIRKLAADGSVLLKNDGILPLAQARVKTIAAIGPNATVARIMGGGSAQINAHYRISPVDGLKALLGDDAVLTAIGCSNNRLASLVETPLTVAFYQGTELAGTPVHVTTAEASDFFWFDMPNKEIDLDDFSVRISGSFTAERTGLYELGLTNAGLANLFLDGERVIDGETDWKRGNNYFGTGNDERRATVELLAGRRYDITAEYRPVDEKEDGINIRAMRFGIEYVLGEAEIDAAVEAARAADIAVLFVGRQGEWDTEGLDLPDMQLPGRQNELIDRVAAENPDTVVVLQTGGPVEMPWLSRVRAVMEMWYPGQELGHAAADLLFGAAEPGGRLPQTFPSRLHDVSAFGNDTIGYPGRDGHVEYREGIFVGYRHFDRTATKPAFPFGFGLSYTAFRWGTPVLSATTIGEEGVSVEIDVTNIGTRRGSDVVQLYVGETDPQAERPVKELKAFARLTLDPGETRTAGLSLSLRDLAYFSVEDQAFRADAGDYDISIAASATDIRARLTLTLERNWIETP